MSPEPFGDGRVIHRILRGIIMDRLDQAFWQVFHAVEAQMSGPEILDSLPADPVPAVTVTLPGPVHAFGVLRREAERRGVSCAELIAVMSAERKAELPPWWLEIAEKREVGVLDRAAPGSPLKAGSGDPTIRGRTAGRPPA